MKKIIIITFVLTFPSILLSQWEKINFPKASPYNVLQTSVGLFATNSWDEIYISTDNGITWDSVSSLSYHGITKILQVGDVFLINTSRSIIWPIIIPSFFRSDDFGKTWYSVHDAIYGGGSIVFCNSKLYVDLDGELYSSNDTGKTWNLLNTPSFFRNQISQVLSDGSSLYVQTKFQALFRSDNDAYTWDSLNINFPNSYDFLLKDSCIYLGTNSNGFYISKDRGDSWEEASAGLPDSLGFRYLHFVGDNIIASVSKNYQQSIYKYNLKENKWNSFNEGFSINPLRYIFDFANNDEYIFLATDSSIWRRPVSDLISSVHNSNNQPINSIILYQNYPNPFNSVTKLDITIPYEDYVKLSIYNSLGQLIEVIAKERLSTGKYSFYWNASNYPSGIYFYRLEANKYFETKKCVLMK